MQEDWNSASAHYNGEGIERCIQDGYTNWTQKHYKDTEHYIALSMFNSITTGG